MLHHRVQPVGRHIGQHRRQGPFSRRPLCPSIEFRAEDLKTIFTVGAGYIFVSQERRNGAVPTVTVPADIKHFFRVAIELFGARPKRSGRTTAPADYRPLRPRRPDRDGSGAEQWYCRSFLWPPCGV
ncbi:hypothetical protein [Streptomyces sp. NPDC003996]